MEEKEVPGGLEMQGHSYKRRNAERDRPKKINEYIKKFVVTYRALLHFQYLLLNIIDLDLLCSIQSNDSKEQKQREGRKG